MRTGPVTAATLLLLVLALFIAGAAHSDTALVVVRDPTPSTVKQLLSAGVMVVRDLEHSLLVAAEPGELTILGDLGLSWQMLDSNIAGKSYYTVETGSEERYRRIGNRVRTLHHDGLEAVVEATPEEADGLAAELEIARVFFQPVRLAPEVKAYPSGTTLQPDPRIQEMVDAVSGATVDAHVQRLQDFVTRYAQHDSCQAAANYIHDQFRSFGIDSVTFHTFSPSYKPNVVAVIPGTLDPSKIVVIGGHYDSITPNHSNCPGADDDASGTACVLECARVLSDYDFDYTLTFVAFCAEEQGLIGSQAFASDAAARGDDIIGAVAVDMIGYVAGGDVMDLDIIDNTSSRWMRELVIEVGSLYVPQFPIVPGTIPGGASSDHASFWANGYDAILFFEDSGDYSPYIHTANDVVGVSYNNPVMAENSVKAAVAMTATLATAPPVTLSHTPLDNTGDTQNPYRVMAEITGTGVLNPDSLVVHYDNGIESGTATLEATGVGNEYEAFIPPQSGGTFVDYYIVAEDVEGHRATHPEDAPATVHTFFVGAITAILEDDFEAANGWTVGDIGDDATTGIWVRVDPNGTWSGSVPVQPEDDHTPAPGIHCFVTGNAAPGASQGSNDVDGGKTTLKSPIFDLSTYPNVWARYYRWYTNDTGSSPETDVWVVDVSSDGGGSWTRFETLTSSERSWWRVEKQLADVDLTAQMQFRFVASDEAPGSIVEAAIDDFALLTYEEGTTAIATRAAGAVPAVSLAQNRPNPFNPRTEIGLSVPLPGRKVTLRIYDVSGRVVATLIDDRLVVGQITVPWDGTTDDGSRLASAVYFYRLTTGETTISRRLVLLR